MGNGSRLPDAVPRTRNARVRTTLVSRGTPARGDARRRAAPAWQDTEKPVGAWPGAGNSSRSTQTAVHQRAWVPAHLRQPGPYQLWWPVHPPTRQAQGRHLVLSRRPLEPASHVRVQTRAVKPRPGGVRPGLHVGRGPQSAKRWAFRVRYTRAPPQTGVSDRRASGRTRPCPTLRWARTASTTTLERRLACAAMWPRSR